MGECWDDVHAANHVGRIHKPKRFGSRELVEVEKADPGQAPARMSLGRIVSIPAYTQNIELLGVKAPFDLDLHMKDPNHPSVDKVSGRGAAKIRHHDVCVRTRVHRILFTAKVIGGLFEPDDLVCVDCVAHDDQRTPLFIRKVKRQPTGGNPLDPSQYMIEKVGIEGLNECQTACMNHIEYRLLQAQDRRHVAQARASA
jgi:hypothetical protein